MSRRFPLGKLPHEVLAKLLSSVTDADPRVIVGPGIGLDAAVLDVGDRYLVAKTDPITFATDQMGWYAVNVNANDVACMGAAPRWFMATLLMPEDQADEALAQSVFAQIKQACEAIGVSLVGGHTEITFGIERPIVVGCMLGEVEPSRLVKPDAIRTGDSVLQVGGIPIEATAIIAREKAVELEGKFETEFIERCANYLIEPGISVVPAVQVALEAGEVHALHDPTEGGLAMGLWELAMASQSTLEVQTSSIHVMDEGRILCEHFGLDPLSSIASGALILAAPPESVDRILTALHAAEIPATEIGEVVNQDKADVALASEEGDQTLAIPERDEITKLFEA